MELFQASLGTTYDSHAYIYGVTEMKTLLARFAQDESGATAIEYALIAAGIALAIITAVNTLGTTLSNKFTSINSSLK
jgi:pilus assembly protein Flp/PilA